MHDTSETMPVDQRPQRRRFGESWAEFHRQEDEAFRQSPIHAWLWHFPALVLGTAVAVAIYRFLVGREPGAELALALGATVVLGAERAYAAFKRRRGDGAQASSGQSVSQQRDRGTT